jgi:hypothetical protein
LRLDTGRCASLDRVTCAWTDTLAKLSNDSRLAVEIIDYGRRHKCCIRDRVQGYDKRSIVSGRWQGQSFCISHAGCPYRLNLKVTKGFVSCVRCGICQGHSGVIPRELCRRLRRQCVGNERRADTIVLAICVDFESDCWYQYSFGHNSPRVLQSGRGNVDLALARA